MTDVEPGGQNRLVNTRDAATLLGKHPTVLADWRHRGRGPRYVRMGRSIRYRLGDLVEFVEAHIVEPAAE